MIKKFAEVIALCVALLIFFDRQSTAASSFASPLYSLYVPAVVNDRLPSKKCVGLSSGFDAQQMLDLGTDCTYAYSPGVSDVDQIEMLGMVQYPDAITVTGSALYFLGFNEPDLGRFGGGPPVTPQMAAEVWPRVVAANPDKCAISPAPSHLHADWLDQFYAAHVARWGYPPALCALAIHCYQSADYCINIVSQVIDYARAWNVPQVWVTEFAFSEDWQGAYPIGATWQSEAQKFIDWLDEQSIVTRYYWWAMLYDSDDPAQWWNYGWHTQLYDWHTGEINERGEFYRDVR